MGNTQHLQNFRFSVEQLGQGKRVLQLEVDVSELSEGLKNAMAGSVRLQFNRIIKGGKTGTMVGVLYSIPDYRPFHLNQSAQFRFEFSLMDAYQFEADRKSNSLQVVARFEGWGLADNKSVMHVILNGEQKITTEEWATAMQSMGVNESQIFVVPKPHLPFSQQFEEIVQLYEQAEKSWKSGQAGESLTGLRACFNKLRELIGKTGNLKEMRDDMVATIDAGAPGRANEDPLSTRIYDCFRNLHSLSQIGPHREDFGYGMEEADLAFAMTAPIMRYILLRFNQLS